MSVLLKRALDHACVWHRDHRRKYPGADVPYASHCAGVAALLARHGFDDEVVAAGALHDTIEDAGVTFERLRDLFGERVASLVRDVSEPDRSQPWEVRKDGYLARFVNESWEAQAITLADKIDNFESILVCAESYGEPWSQFKRGREAQLARFDALDRALDKLAPHSLIDAYREALGRVKRV